MKNEITVLSLFDGMSCGQQVLQRAGIKINKYYASEIEKHPIMAHNTIMAGPSTSLRISLIT